MPINTSKENNSSKVEKSTIKKIGKIKSQANVAISLEHDINDNMAFLAYVGDCACNNN
jgi:hypothetical protein